MRRPRSCRARAIAEPQRHVEPAKDLDSATETKIHQSDCRYYVERKQTATTVRWHGPFSTYDEARNAAQTIAAGKRNGFKGAGCCNPE